MNEHASHTSIGWQMRRFVKRHARLVHDAKMDCSLAEAHVGLYLDIPYAQTTDYDNASNAITYR